MLGWMDIMLGTIVVVFLATMFIVLWNTGLMGNIRRYGEIGVRLAMGETKGQVVRSMIGEAAVIGFSRLAHRHGPGAGHRIFRPAPWHRLQRHDAQCLDADDDTPPHPRDRQRHSSSASSRAWPPPCSARPRPAGRSTSGRRRGCSRSWKHEKTGNDPLAVPGHCPGRRRFPVRSAGRKRRRPS